MDVNILGIQAVSLRLCLGQGPCPSVNPSKIVRSQPESRGSEQGRHGCIVMMIDEHTKMSHHHGNIRQRQQPGEVCHSHRDVTRAQRIVEVGNVAVASDQDCGIGPPCDCPTFFGLHQHVGTRTALINPGRVCGNTDVPSTVPLWSDERHPHREFHAVLGRAVVDRFHGRCQRLP